MSAAAHELATTEHALGRVADLYAATLEEAAGGEAVREAVTREVAEAAADVGIGPDDPEAKELAAACARLSLGKSLPRVPAWAWLVGIVTVSTLVRYAVGRGTVAPWIMVDELIYSELAKSLADSGRFLVRGEATAAYGIVYPALIAPAWAIFESVPQAYAAAKAINALVMSLAAVPAYFLARRVLAEPLALVAAALTVAVPSMVYTATLMTENAFYPLFLCAALAMVLWLERPTRLRTAIVLGVSLALPHPPAGGGAAAGTADGAAARGREGGVPPLCASLRTGCRRLGILVVQLARGRSPLGVFGATRWPAAPTTR